jgi:surface protein
MAITKIKIVPTMAGTQYDATKAYRLQDYIVIDNTKIYFCKRVDKPDMTCTGHPLTDTDYWDTALDLTDMHNKMQSAADRANNAAAGAEKVNAQITDDTLIISRRDGTLQNLPLASETTVQKLLSEVDGRISKVWARVWADEQTWLYVNDVLTEIPAKKNVMIKDFDQLVIYYNQYGEKKGRYSERIKKLEIHYNGLYAPTRWEFGYWGAYSEGIQVEELDVSGLDTSKMTDFGYMFCGMTKVKKLDVSGWDTSSATSIGVMFTNCSSLTSLDVSGWDTSKVTQMGHVFNNCSSLTNLDLSGWDTSKVTSLGNMFSSCSNLTNILFGPKWGTQTSTEANALTLDLSECGSSQSYKLTDATWESMLTMYDRKTAGLTNMTIKISSKHNVPDGWIDKMTARGYTITKV